MADSTRRILLFGGTFDPPHRAHVELPALVAQRLECDRIIYIPAAQSPLKDDAPRCGDAHRLVMLRLATRDLPQAEISTIELDRGGTSYFIDTVTAMRRRLGDEAGLCFLIGADQALEFHHWKDWRGILERAAPAVMLRPPWTRERFEEALRREYDEDEAARWMACLVDAPRLEISATDIRDRLAGGEPVDDLLDPLVLGYIRTHRLYT
ncbi:MAG: nicotinate (nicotinamide) nucleotide adenylyltransferase [Planctomycetota bacterium]|nr:nicotinate (nicotinamide) nucleotide adenylyltransferase [Planctomycetota bacterium]